MLAKATCTRNLHTLRRAGDEDETMCLCPLHRSQVLVSKRGASRPLCTNTINVGNNEMADPQASKTSALPTDTASATPTGSKFSALPDIDTSAIDVYETPSSPELKPVKHTSRSKHGAAHGDAGQVESDDSNDDDGLDGTDGVAAARRRRKKAQQEDDGRGEIDSTAIPSDLAKARFKDSTDLASGEFVPGG